MTDIKPDILSALSQSGSGLQLKSLTASLVEAEISRPRAQTERRVEDANTSISAMGQLSAELDRFRAGMTRTAEAASRSASSTTAAAVIEVTQEALASDVNAVVEVTSLAAPQVLTVSFASGTTSSSAVPTGTIALAAPGWDSAREAVIDTRNDTLGGLTRALNGVDGLSAALIDTGDGMALIVKSTDGTANALGDASITAIREALGMTPAGTEGQSDPAANPLGVSVAITAATDARLTVDGVQVTRGTNAIDDLFPGHRVTLGSLGTATLTSSESNTSVRDRISTFLGEVNALKSYLDTATQRGINGAEPGPLAGDVAAQSVLGKVRGITTQPITGFGPEPVFLAQLGIRTERDGTLTLDEDRLNEVMQRNPRIADALFATQFSADHAGIAVTGLSAAPPRAGSYALAYDPATVPPTATLNGQALSVGTDGQGRPVLRASGGDANGMRITLETDSAVTTKVHYGVSLAGMMADYAEALVGSNGLLARREGELTENRDAFEAQLAEIEHRAALLTERYNIQFGRMEAMIASLNKTGEYMKSLMDSWNAKT